MKYTEQYLAERDQAVWHWKQATFIPSLLGTFSLAGLGLGTVSLILSWFVERFPASHLPLAALIAYSIGVGYGALMALLQYSIRGDEWREWRELMATEEGKRFRQLIGDRRRQWSDVYLGKEEKRQFREEWNVLLTRALIPAYRRCGMLTEPPLPPGDRTRVLDSPALQPPAKAEERPLASEFM